MWRRWKGKSRSRFVEILPGLFVMGLAIGARSLGLLQPLELGTLDLFLRLRPPEEQDERITIVGIGEADIERIGSYPLPDRDIANLLRRLQQYNPTVIGLDIQRHLPVEPGHAELLSAFQELDNLIAVEKLFSPKSSPPPDFPLERVGFSDFPYDVDFRIRRHFLGSPHPKNSLDYRFSLSLQLAAFYLAKTEGLKLGNGWRDPAAIRFGQTEIPRFFPNSGGYARADAGGLQGLLNFRNHPQPFRRVSLQDIEAGTVDPSWFRDRIVIIGVTAPSFSVPVRTAAIAQLNPPGRIDGIEFHAHATSQILSAVLDARSFLTTWSEVWEYLWICAWGFVGMGLTRKARSRRSNFIALSLATASLMGISYLAAILGTWIPVIPAGLVLILTHITYLAFSEYGELLKSRINERQRLIERTFNVIHNGPLQTLANLLRQIRDENIPSEQLLVGLENLNYEIRALGEQLEREILEQEEHFYLGRNIKLDLRQPLHELFYQVYSSTLERDFLCFQTLKIKVRKFEPLDTSTLSIEQKRVLCRFLEEALCNVGKYAVGSTRLIATGKQDRGWYNLCIVDNGPGICSNSEGRGTKQLRKFAKLLAGEFKRETLASGGTLCELMWPIKKH